MKRPDDLAETTGPNEPPPVPHRHAERLPPWAVLTIGALGLGMASLGLLLWVTRSSSSADIRNLENRLGELCAAGDSRAACQNLPPTIIVTPGSTASTIQPPATATSAAQRPPATATTVGSSRPSSTVQGTTAPPTSPPSSTTAPPPSSTSTTRRTIVPTLPSLTVPVDSNRRAVTGRALADELTGADLALIAVATVAIILLLAVYPRRR